MLCLNKYIPRTETFGLRRGDGNGVGVRVQPNRECGGAAVVAVTLGGRQRLPTSCLLFIIFVNFI